ncbi:MAG TPA: PIN/TRAM domain-containing protein [Firmicutes bacterium]|nr:PIN/TRAM domain-containing protein [Bacillota bacterium]
MNKKLQKVFTAIGFILGCLAGFYSIAPATRLLGRTLLLWQQGLWLLAAGLLLAAVAYWLSPKCVSTISSGIHWLEARLQRASVQEIVAGTIGLIFGLIIGNLIGQPMARMPLVGTYIPALTTLFFGYLGATVGQKKRDEILAMFNFLPKLGPREKQPSKSQLSKPKILDTSVIIDGRIADICVTGFMEGPLIVPGFVLEELRHIADSSDTLKRNRGRRGLEVLNRMQKELNTSVHIYEKDVPGAEEVDSKLVKLAKGLNGVIVTNDFNLNKVAELQGMKVLNINELANALKPVVLPGEEMAVHVIKDGKEAGQGIGYLDDGTMIVVDGGKRYIGETILVMVTSVLQTAAGRMIFAKPKAMEKVAP